MRELELDADLRRSQDIGINTFSDVTFEWFKLLSVISKLREDKWLLQTVLQPIASAIFLLLVSFIKFNGGDTGPLNALFESFFEGWALLYMSFSLLITTFLFTYDEQPTPTRSILVGFGSIFICLVIAVLIGSNINYGDWWIAIISASLYILSFILFYFMAEKNSEYFNKKRKEYSSSEGSANDAFKDVDV